MSRPVFKTCRDFLDSRDRLFLSRSRFLKSILFNQDLAVSRFLSRSSRLIETFETNRDKTRFFEIFVKNRDFVEINRDFVEKNRDFVSLDRDFNNLLRLFLDLFGPFGLILDRSKTITIWLRLLEHRCQIYRF